KILVVAPGFSGNHFLHGPTIRGHLITKASSLTEVAFAVCTALDRAGTKAVLTGGSAATYYAPDAYQSGDLDFVIAFHGADAAEPALLALGYRREGLESHRFMS